MTPMSQVMPPKDPAAGAEFSDDEIAEALASVDLRIAELRQTRAEWLERLAKNKVKNGLADSRSEVNLAAKNQSNSQSYNQPKSSIKTVFLGPLGTYTHDAALQLYGTSMQAMPVESFAEIFAAVENGSADFGVAPIENSTEGAVSQTHDLLIKSQVQICGEVRLRIRHCFMSQSATLSDVRVVYAHPQSLGQCRQWLNANLPGVECVSESSNAAAADRARQSEANEGVAAIASASAASRYGLRLISEGIEDISNNTTRFIVIGRDQPSPTGNDATSLLISAPHKPGGLRRMLQPLEDAGVSMTRIESRPARTQMWEYVFFIDVTGHCKDPELSSVLHQLEQESPLVRVLGSYPKAET